MSVSYLINLSYGLRLSDKLELMSLRFLIRPESVFISYLNDCVCKLSHKFDDSVCKLFHKLELMYVSYFIHSMFLFLSYLMYSS